MAYESYRTRAAKLAAAADALNSQSGRAPAPFSLAFITDAARIPRPELIARSLPPGAAVILRDYDAPDREALARRFLSICAPRNILLFIGADPDLARGIGAQGVHWPSWADVKNASDLLATRSCHNGADLARAAADRMDAAFLSPAFPTNSHPGAAALGPEQFKKLAANADAPVIALGGVDEKTAPMLAGQNVAGIAAIGAFLPT